MWMFRYHYRISNLALIFVYSMSVHKILQTFFLNNWLSSLKILALFYMLLLKITLKSMKSIVTDVLARKKNIQEKSKAKTVLKLDTQLKIVHLKIVVLIVKRSTTFLFVDLKSILLRKVTQVKKGTSKWNYKFKR